MLLGFSGVHSEDGNSDPYPESVSKSLGFGFIYCSQSELGVKRGGMI